MSDMNISIETPQPRNFFVVCPDCEEKYAFTRVDQGITCSSGEKLLIGPKTRRYLGNRIEAQLPRTDVVQKA
jgi:ribosomal protein S27E